MVTPISIDKLINSEAHFTVTKNTTAFSTIKPEDTAFVLKIDKDGDNIIDADIISESYKYNNWDYNFTDPKNGNQLKINLSLKQFQFITKDRIYPTIYDPNIMIKEHPKFKDIKIKYENDLIYFFANILDSKNKNTCIALLYDKSTHKLFSLISLQ